MKLFLPILLLALFPASHAGAREPAIPVSGKAVYFDVSPPLRNLSMQQSSKADCSWKDGFVSNALPSGRLINNTGSVSGDTVIQIQNGHVPLDTTTRNFDGLDNINNVVPPDTHGDAGPSHFFQLVNLSFAIYDKAGVRLLGPLNTSSIWEGLPHNSNNGDGIVLYDEQADRWLISQFSFPTFPQGPFYQMVAVSQTPDPLGSWYRWEFAFSDLPDYPKFGIWPDGYYMSGNRLKSKTLQWDGAMAVAFNRTAMISGEAVPENIQFALSSSESPASLLPADCDGPFPPYGTPNYFGYLRNGFLCIREFHADWINPSASSFSNLLQLPVSPYSNFSQGGIPQKESDKLLTPLDNRLMYRLQYRSFNNYQAMVANHTVGVGLNTGVRWYELRKTNGNWFINQQSTYAPDSLSRWMGSIAMDATGNIALGYSVSGYSIFPSVRFTGRMSHDPPGQMTIGETHIIDGTGSQTGIWNQQSRWGDYSSMSVDPASPSTFWYTQEYYGTSSFNSWKTRIASFSFAGILDIKATATPSEVCAGDTTRLGVDVSGGSGPYTYLWTSDPAGFSSGQESPVITPAIPATYIVRVTSGAQVKTDSVIVPVIPGPVVFAGNDTVICRYLSQLPLTGTVTNCTTLRWFTYGDGYFTHPDELNTTYYPGLNDKLSDRFILKLSGYPAAPCMPVSATLAVAIDTCTGLDDPLKDAVRVKIYPNPVHDILTINIAFQKAELVNISIFNFLGQTLFSDSFELTRRTNPRQADVSRFSKGIYLIRIQTTSGIVVRPFLVQ